MLPSNHKDIQIELTNAAKKQIELIMENDFTLEGLRFRLKIGGKGCDGFTYETGFSKLVAEDIILDFDGLEIILDKLTTFYCKEGLLDFQMVPGENQDGFTFINKNEEKYHGKFFKDESMAPDFEGNPE